MTDIPTIATLPPAPQRGQDAAVFVQRADAFIDALKDFVAQMNAFGAQLVQATQERVVNEAAASYNGALAARDAAITARDAAQGYAASINPANLVNLTGNQAIAGTKNFTGILQLAGAAITLAATFPEATTADMLANVQSRLVSVRASWNALVSVALTDAATIAVDLNLGINFTVTIAGNRVLGNPANGKPGQTGSIFVTQDATGGRVLSFGANYVPDDLSSYPLLNTPAGSVTELRYKVAPNGKVRIYGGKPASRSLRIQDYMISDSNQGTYSPGVYSPGSIARTVTVYPIAGSGGALIYRRDSSFNVVENLATVGAGFLSSFTYTVPADQSLFFLRNGNGGNVGVRVEENS
jgi:hypothetical protein